MLAYVCCFLFGLSLYPAGDVSLNSNIMLCDERVILITSFLEMFSKRKSFSVFLWSHRKFGRIREGCGNTLAFSTS